MTDRELLELIATQVGALTTKVDSIETRFDSIETRFDSMETRFDSMETRFDSMETTIDTMEADLKETKERLINLENDHGKKLDLLFDGYKQNSDKLDRIENEVSKHEEIILRRIK